MGKQNSLPFQAWKVIPLAVIFVMWTIYALHRQYTQRPDRLDKTQQKLDEHSIFISETVIDPPPVQEENTPIAIPPPDQQTTLLHEAGKDLPVDLSSPPPSEYLPTLIVYAYSESTNARENFQFFLSKGLHGCADFVFIVNGETDAETLLPQNESNVRVVKRENRCYDLGTLGEFLAKDGLWVGYKKFNTMNASIRGPFLPTYSSGSCWSDVFLERITEKVKLVGTTMNCQPYPHVQSMLLATDDVGMSILLNPALSTSVHKNDFFGSVDDPKGLTPCYNSMRQAIHGELGLTELIHSEGYEVDVLLTAFQAHTPTNYCEKNGFPQDILYEGRYFGSNLHPYELVFIKANRNIDPRLLEVMTIWHLALNTSSWDTCGRGQEATIVTGRLK